MYGSMRLYDILPRGELKPHRSLIVPFIGGRTPLLSHVANGFSLSPCEMARFSLVLIRNPYSPTKLLTLFTHLAA